MYAASISARFSRFAVQAAFAVGLALAQGCGTAIIGRTRVSIEKASGTEKLGGPYYVMDAPLVVHALRRPGVSETLHEACQKRYPELFSKKRSAIPLLVTRHAETRKTNSRVPWSALIPISTLWILPAFPQTAVIQDGVEINTAPDAQAAATFVSEETIFMHSLLTFPVSKVLFPESRGWGPETDDQSDPNARINDTRLAGYADAIVACLASMSEETRGALAENPLALRHYYEIRPYVMGHDIVPHSGEIIHEIAVERPAATGRMPVLAGFAYDPGHRTGQIRSDLSGCDALFAQRWTIYQLLPEVLKNQVSQPGERAILIQSEHLSAEGVYTLDFAVVE